MNRISNFLKMLLKILSTKNLSTHGRTRRGEKLETKNWSFKNWSLLKTLNLKLETILLLFALLMMALPFPLSKGGVGVVEAATRESVKVKPQIAAGGDHTLAIKSDGTLWAWGYNGYGQLGDGTTVGKTSPTQIGTDNKWVLVSAGLDHTIALKSDGTLWAWGWNLNGQLGDGTTTQRTSPVQIGTDNKWVSIAAGGWHTVALKSDGTMWAWGYNAAGQLGDGTAVDKTSPIQIGTDNKWVSIAAGGYHTVALKSDGTLWAWGYNAAGQLGDGTTVDKTSPIQIGTDNKWVLVSAGLDHTIALKSDGTLWAWGSNGGGQLGDGTTVDKSFPVQIGTDNKWISIAAVYQHTVALKSDGTLWAWGYNYYGQLGDGTTVDKTTPTQIGTDNKWISIAAGYQHTVALKSDGTLWAWGWNGSGQLGDGTTVDKSSPLQIMQVGTGNEWGKIAAGYQHTLALKSDGTLWAWGLNDNYGQLGDGTKIDKSSPVQIGTDNKWVAITSGESHSIALKSDGTLWGWGKNYQGQVGDGTTDNERSSPVQIGTDNKWISISAGYDHTAALKSDGTLWAWGINQSGQLGDGTTTNRENPTQIGTDNNWKAIAAGNSHTVALKTDGTLWAWGYNYYGNLGDGTTTTRLSPVQIGTDNKWVSISAGYFHTVALKSDGTLWTWGYNGYGGLGDGTIVNKSSPIQIGTDNNWVLVSADSYRTNALKSDGTLWAWGRNTVGELGDGTGVDKYSPTQIGTDNKWLSVSFSASSVHTLALKSDGTLWAWGYNARGQVGDCTTTNRLSPVQITGSCPDTTPPTTTASPAGGTYSSAQSVTLTCSDGTGSGCKTTNYCLGSGCTPVTAYTTPISISNSTDLRFYSIDFADNSEAIKTETYTIGGSVVQLPRTGQTKCYDSAGTEIACTGTGQDGAIQAGAAWPSPRFTDNSDQTITDNLTGLMWTKDAGTPTSGSCTGGTKTWQDALNYVACLNTNNYLGHNDWRLPNVNELESLINAGQADIAAWLNGQGFSNVQAFLYWSSSTYAAGYTDYAWYVYMWQHGGVFDNVKTYGYYVWPVRAGGSLGYSEIWKTGQTKCYDSVGTEIACAGTGQDGEIQAGVAWPSPRFTDNGDGTVTDNLTGLIWLKNANCFGTKIWNDALTAANTLANSQCGLSDGSGAGDWRLPNMKELKSLIDYSQFNPALPSGYPFSNVQSYDYWSSTTNATVTYSAWYVNMSVGYVEAAYESYYYVWPVRGGTVTPSDTTPPTGSISINSGATYTNSTSVTLTLSCTDSEGSCAEMQFSNDNVTYSTAETYATSKSWTLSTGDGTKTVYAKFKDTAGNWSGAYSDTIILDTFAPPGSGGRAWRRPLYDIGGTSFYPYASSPNSGALNLQWNKTAVENVLTADINGDAFLEVIASTGSALLAYDKGGNVLWSVPTTAKLSYIGDADGDGNFEIFTTYKDASNSLKMDVYSGAGSFIKTITWGTGGYDSSWYVIHNKGDKLVAVNEAGYSLFPRGLSFLSYSSGSLLSFYGQGPLTWTAAMGDINNDGLLEVATSTYTSHNGASANGTSDNNMYGIVTNENGVNVFTKIITDWDPTTSPDGALYWAFADLNNDNVPEMIAFESHDPTYYHGTNHVYLINNSGQKLKEWVGPVDGEFGGLSIADINGDGYKDIVVEASANSGVIYALDKDLNLFAQSPAWAGRILAVNDFNGDGQNEVIVYQASSGRVRVLKGDLLTEVASYNVGSLTLAGRKGYAVLSDIDNDGKNELIVAADSGLYVLGPTPSETTPPTGTVSINSGATYTNTTSVTLTLSCTDASGCAEMQFSNDNVTYSTAEAYATSKSWTLSSGDGTKTVYVKFKDTAGNWSSAYSDTIGLETVAPTGSISINSGYTYTNSISVTLSLTCNDSGSGCAEMKFSNDNSTYSTAETYATSKTWTLTGGDGTKIVYAKFKDNAGNWSIAYSDTIILDTTAPTTTASPAGGTYSSAQSVTLTCSDAGSGCGNTYYCLGSGCTPATAYTGAINISSTTDLRFYSTDNAGKSESVKTVGYQISTGTGVSGKSLNSEWYLDLNTVYGWGYFGITPAIVNIPGVNSYGGEPNSDLEIVTGSDGYWSHANPSISVSGLWRAIDSKGNVEWYRNTLSDESRGSIAIADVNEDGNLEFIGSTTSGTSVQVMDRFGNFVWTFPDGPKKGIQQAGGFYFPSAPAVADLNPAVSGLEIVVMHRPSGTIIVLDGDNSDGVNDGITFTGIGGFTWTGTEGLDWDVLWTYTTGGYDSHGSPAIGDVDNDGALEVVVGSQGGNVYVLNGITGAAEAVFTTSAIQASPALANLDADPYLEIVIGDTDGTLYVLGWDGVNAIVKSSKYLGSPIYSSASIGDLDGDGSPDIVVGTYGGKVYAFNNNLDQKWVYPTTGSVGEFYSSPSLADRANVSPYDIEWQMFRHDAQRTGFYGSSSNPLDVFIGSMDSYLYQIEGKTGSLIDKFQSSGPIHGSPTIGDIDGDGKLNIIFESWGQYGGSTDMDRLWNIEEAALYITINSDASFTNSTSVTLSLSCPGDCVQMQFSNDNVTYSPAETFATSKSWTLSSGDGTKTVYVKFKDNAGNWSTAYSDTIVLDATVPTGTISINSGNTYTNSTSVTLSLTCSDTNGCKEMQFSNDNVTYETAETYATTKSWTLTSGDGIKTVYVKSKDNADNWSSAYSDTIELDTILSITGSITINSGATYTKSTSVTLNLTCSASTGCAEVKFSNDNVTYLPLIAETYATSKSWTLTGGDGTKAVYAKFKDNVDIWSDAYSDTITLDTTPPSKPKNIEVNQGSNKDELVITWTKPSDSDFSHIHIYRSTTSGVLGSLIADNLTDIKYTDTGLASQATYYYTVRAVDNAGNESTNTNTQSNEYGLYPYATTPDFVPPLPPTNITASDAGTGGKINLSWTNPADSDFSHIHIYRSTVAGNLGNLIYDNITSTSQADTGLTNGLTYYYVIRSVDTSGNASTNTLQVYAAPTAPDVTAPGAVSSVVISNPATGGALNISWTNPADSDFAKVRIYRSTIEGQLGSLVYEVTGNSVTDTGLTSGTTYYYTFRTVDTVGNESSDTNQYSGMPTDAVAPNPVTELTATLLSGGKVKLDWIRSSSEDINYYNIYYDNGTGTIDYTTAIASIQHPTVTWTSGALTVGTRYQFAIRAEDTSFNKETNKNVISVVPVTDPNAGDVSASIKVPQTGKKVCGNMVTVMAELLMGTVADTQKIRLQYKTVASGIWSDIPSTDPAKFPNPDTTSPYFVHWNVTTLADGDYNLRAVATNNALVTDSNPSYITITVDSVNCSSQETTNAGGEKTKAEDVSKNASSNSVMAGSTGVTTVALPEGSLDADTKINITESDPATKAGLVPSGYSNGSSFNEIGFESGQTTLANNKKATVEIPYKDNDNNKVVDGAAVNVYDLQICNYKSGTGWTCLDSLVDTDKKTVKAKTEKFNLFGLLMPPKPVGAKWNLLSVPLQPSPNTPSAVFGSITNYPNYVLWWNPSIEDYQIVSTIETGKSYWVWGNGNNLTTVSGIETPNSNFSISIKKGWDMVGHPFRYKVNVSDLWIYYGGNYYTIADAETNGWVVATVYKYENGAYQFQSAQDGGVLEAWKGYWILSDIDCTLIVPPTPAQ